MLLGYNTNGFVHHKFSDTAAIISELGYGSVALTLERDHLDPPDRSGVAACVERLKPILEAAHLRITIETGSPFILDPRWKHQPTLVSSSPEGRRKRVEFLKAAVDVAEALSADSVSLWSGAPDDSSAAGGGRYGDSSTSGSGRDESADDAELFGYLTAGLREVLGHAETGNVRLSFEPEPGMVIDTMAGFEKLHAALDHPLFGLTLDVGHVHCLDDRNLCEHVCRWKDVLWNVHVEDMRRGVHEHLMFGDGEMDFSSVFEALAEIDHLCPVHVELSRHSHDAVKCARRSYEFLMRYVHKQP